MFYILEAFLSIKKKLIPNLLIVVSLIIAFSSSIVFISNLSGYKDMLKTLSKLSKYDKNYYELYTTQNPEIFTPEAAINNYNQFIKNLSSTVNIKNISSYSMEKYNLKFDNSSTTLDTIVVDKHINDYFNIVLQSGRYFDDSEFYTSSKSIIPIILGYNYRNNAKIGQIISSGQLSFKVIGFLEQNSPFTCPRNSKMFENQINILDNSALIPLYSDLLSNPRNQVQRYYNGLIIETTEKETVGNIQKKVKTAVNKIGGYKYSYYVTNVDNLMTNRVNGEKNMIYPLILSGTIFIFSLFSVIIMALANMYMEQKNIAIKLALGASNLKLSINYLIQNIILFIVSTYLSIVYFYHEYSIDIEMSKFTDGNIKTFFGDIKITQNSIIIILFISFFTALLVFLIIYRNISKVKSSYMKELL